MSEIELKLQGDLAVKNFKDALKELALEESMKKEMGCNVFRVYSEKNCTCKTERKILGG